MTTILHLDASARFARSHSRKLSLQAVEWIQERSPTEVEVIRRDLADTPPPHVTEDWIAAAFCDPNQRTPAMQKALAVSDLLVDEVLAADLLVCGVPMYNYGPTSSFKAWTDNIVRVGRTFGLEIDGERGTLTGLLKDKQLILVSARGEAGFDPGGINAHRNHLEPWAHTIFGMIGIEHIESVAVEKDEFGGVGLEESIRRARSHLSGIIDRVLARLEEPTCHTSIR